MAKPFKSARSGGAGGRDRRAGGGGRFDGARGGGKRFGGKPFGEKKLWERGASNRDGGKVFMHKATCAECGDMCQVPFKPNGTKPVLCSMCFQKSGGKAPSRPFEDRRAPMSGGAGSIDRDQLKAINTKLDAILKILEGEE